MSHVGQPGHVYPGSRPIARPDNGDVATYTPVVQRLLDSPVLLLLTGLAIPGALFLAWRAVQGWIVS